MDRLHKKMVIGMGITLGVSALIITIMTVFQNDIIRGTARFFRGSNTYRFLITTPFARGTVIPYYMYLCVLVGIITMVVTILTVANKKNAGRPKAAIAPFVVYGVSFLFEIIFYLAGVERFLNPRMLASNVNVLTYVISIVVSPIMVVFFAFFMVTMITFIVKAVRLQKQKAMPVQNNI